MIDLRGVFENTRKKLIRRFLKDYGFDAFKKTLFLSYLGARICYAERPPLCLFEEEKFKDKERLKGFLLHLKRAGHTSVFAHSPAVFELLEEEEQSVPFLFKAWFDPESKRLQINLRHVAEALSDDEFEKLLEASVSDESYREFDAVAFEGEALERSFKTKLYELIEEFSKREHAKRRVTVIEVPDNEPFGWFVVIVEGFSRIFSHQFVRHTWLNFNQRSHRYTKADDFVVPPSIKGNEQLRRSYEEEVKRLFERYEAFVSEGIKKEDARFVLPQGITTALISSGPLFVWKDFVEKRAHPKAQWEIRLFAERLHSSLPSLPG